MRFSALAIALAALTAVSATAADSNKDTLLVARTGPAAGGEDAARMSKRQTVHNNHLKRKSKRATGSCKPRSNPPQVSIQPQAPSNPPVLVADPPKAPEPQPQEQPKPQEPVKQEPPKEEPPKQEPVKQDPAPPANNNGGGGSGTADAKLGGVSAFHGTNSGIMSWFYTNHGGDSTNGESWCQTRYKVSQGTV